MPADAGLSLASVTLRVSDVERSAEYYSGLVGLRASSIGGDRATLADPGSGAARLELVRAERPGLAPDVAAGLFHVAFLYPDRTGLGAALQRIGSGDYELAGASDHGVSEALYLRDPDNLGIELYRDRPRERWPMNGDRIAMFSAPLDLAPIAAEAGTGDAEQTAAGVRIGHVHLQVGELDSARSFWLDEVGLELTAEMPDAVFMAADGYHHHIAANTWRSAGAAPAPRSGPGLEQIAIERLPAELTTPEGIALTPA